MLATKWLLLALSAFALAGCARFTIYRSDLTPCSVDDAADLNAKCPASAVQVVRPSSLEHPGYVLGFIEFDDQGQLWNNARRQRSPDDPDGTQLQAVMKAVDTETDQGKTDYLMVVFVHGWKNDASLNNTNVAEFKSALGQLSDTEARLSQKVGRPARRIIGIYLGWRGESINVPILDDLTFWDRKNTAHKVGHGEVTEVLSKLEQMRQQRIQKDPATRSRLVIVGHSFGGAVVFSALEQILESSLVKSISNPADSTPVQGFGNLVVLVNPAFEAQLYAPLSDLAIERRAYISSQLPVMAVLTSEADWATGIAFPIGRWFSTRFEKQRKVTRENPVTGKEESIDQVTADVDTVGHFEPYRTHYLKATPIAPASPLSGSSSQSTDEKVRLLATASQQWQDDKPGSDIVFPGSLLTRTSNSAGRNPYLVIKVDKILIRDHDDIWGQGVRDFIADLILIASQSVDLQERAEHREAAGK